MGKGPAGNRSQAKGTARLRSSAVALDRRANLCVAGPMATAQGRLRVFAGNHRSPHSYCDDPAHAATTGPSVTLFKRALSAAKETGFAPVLVFSSSDSNLPMSLGIPAVTIGRGGASDNLHSLNE